ncbi:hypothetical protein BJ878DRAFT_579585 [Calycina marina]|uniref:Heme haloperoxidase family profile domain-containing protein n=1 Tax=Calycina marina TaxID=1763456 RepID=A0A9P7ZBV3_9HELO|nr:hypothetical protein BJ878DRAFT_579585 [Calycina marina]
MKYSINFALAFSAANFVAFPSRVFDLSMSEHEKRALAGISAGVKAKAQEWKPDVKRTPEYFASQQYVSNTGAHAFEAPEPKDLCGPCSGLNAMANHSYLPHNRVAMISQFVQGTYDVFAYGAVMDGGLTSWSIRDPPSSSLLSSFGLLGTPQGISGSHNKYEADASPTRHVLYGDAGNDYKLILHQFNKLCNSSLWPDGYDLSTLITFRAKRFKESQDTNPYFFNGPFIGVAVQPAAYIFIYRFMSNKSTDFPEGYLNAGVLKTFSSITGDSSASFKWTEGYESIPDSWCKPAIGDEYTISYFQSDLVAAALDYSQLLDVGGNTGTVDSFTGVDVQALTGGVFNTATLAEGNNAFCFAFQFAQQVAPDLLKGLFSAVTKPLDQLSGAISTVLAALSCPQLEPIDCAQFSHYPGSTGAC